MKWIVASLSCAVLISAGAAFDARTDFKRIQRAAKAADSDVLQRVIPASLVEAKRWNPKEIEEWRGDLANAIASAKVLKVRQKGEEAVVRMQLESVPGDVELPLRLDGERWVLAAAQPYSLASRKANEPAAEVKLSVRSTNGAYGDSAFSFTHVTADPDLCKNRMDVWFCHNGELHLSRNDRIAKIKASSLRKVDGVPVGVDWVARVAPKKGAVYVLHCNDPRRRDFYLKLKVISVSKGGIELEWDILAAGFNAPASIHEPQPLETKDAADGTDGLCSKR